MKVYATFKGYAGRLNGRSRKYESDEWLCKIYTTERAAKEAVREFGEGKDFDNERELQITRFFERGQTIFENGPESLCELSGGNCQWMRYQEYELQGS